MKRKRGYKKGQKKGKRKDPVKLKDVNSVPISENPEDTECIDQNDDSEDDPGMDSDPPPVEAGKASDLLSSEADHRDDSSTVKTGLSRLKVKLKSSASNRSHSDVRTPSDTDKSNQQAALGLNSAAVEKEDSTYSDGQSSYVYKKVPKKAASIRIKSSKASDLLSEDVQNKNQKRPPSPQDMLVDRLNLSDEKNSSLSLPKDLRNLDNKQSYKDPRYNEKELNAALVVIKKIMKMDAAEPFNAPVDPIALGIPDYFDIIDTPMDFGTICHDLEHGMKYKDSEDVFKDVQVIWDNCYKYNNKGDYVVDLMKRVKKNFTKYWMAAGLYFNKPDNRTTGRAQVEDGIQPSKEDKFYSKGKHKHKRRRHGIDLHKSDCLCAVCVVRRRRKEREKNPAIFETQSDISNANLPRESKAEVGNKVSSPIDNNSSGDDTSSHDHSEETDPIADAEEVDKNEQKVGILQNGNPDKTVNQDARNGEVEPLEHGGGNQDTSLPPSVDNADEDDSSKQLRGQESDSGIATETVDQKDGADVHPQDQDEDGRHGESTERTAKHAMVQENPSLQENHSVLQICKSLFPANARSVWNGPHSFKRHYPVPRSRDSPIHAALATFMKR